MRDRIEGLFRTLVQLPLEFSSTEVIMPQTNEVFIKLVNKLNQVISQVRK